MNMNDTMEEQGTITSSVLSGAPVLRSRRILSVLLPTPPPLASTHLASTLRSPEGGSMAGETGLTRAERATKRTRSGDDNQLLVFLASSF